MVLSIKKNKLKVFSPLLIVILLAALIIAPLVTYIYTSSDNILVSNSEATAFGIRNTAAILAMDFNTISENAPTIYINSTPIQGTYIKDNSIYNNYGTANGYINDSAWRNIGSKINNSLQFDGVDDYVNIPSLPNLGSNYTLSWWYFTNSLSTTGVDGNGVYMVVSNTNQWDVRISPWSPATCGAYMIATGVTGGSCWGKLANFSAGNWMHLVMVVNNFNTTYSNVTIFVNGSRLGTNSFGAQLVTNGNIRLGSGITASGGLWKPSMDEVMLFNRSLSQTEITDLYNNQSLGLRNSGLETDSNLVSYYKFDELSGNVANDSKGNNTSTLTNYPSLTTPLYGAAGGPDGSGAYMFDGVNDVISGSVSSITGPFTLSTWVKRNGANADNTAIIDVGTYSTTGFGLWMNAANSTAWRINGIYNNYKTAVNLSSNSWEYITVVYSGANVSMYKNGIMTTTEAYSVNPVSGVTYSLGKRQDSATYFNGSLDHVQIFNRALSASEVMNLYNGTLANKSARHSPGGTYASPVQYNSYPTYWNVTINKIDGNQVGDIADNNGINLSNPNLVSYWALDENFNDAKGANNGVCTTNCPNNASGLSSNAMRYDGLTQGIYAGNVGAVDGLSIWFKPAVAHTTATTNRYFIGSTGSSQGIFFGSSTSVCANELINIWNNGASARTCVLSSSLPSITADWHHMVLSWNGTQYLVYYDNQLMTGYTLAGTQAKLSYTDLGIGYADYAAALGYFNGSLDEVLVYNTSLTLSQVSQLYKSGLSQHANTNVTLQTRTAQDYNNTDPSLIGHWGLNGYYAEDSQGRFPATPSGGIISNSANTCKVGSCLNYDGVDDKLTSSVTLNGVPSATFSIWAKIKYDAGANNYLWIIPSGGAFQNYFNTDGAGMLYFSTFNGTGVTYKTVGYNVTNQTGNWVLITGVVASGQYNQLYLNGQWVANSSTVYNGNFLQSGNMEIGRYSSGFAVNGSLDEFMIFNRSLSASEINLLYANQNNGRKYLEYDPNLVSYYAFDEDEIGIWKDDSGHGLNGTTTTAPVYNSSAIVGPAMSFNDGNFIDLGTPSSLNMSSNMSVSLWFNTNDFSTQRYLLSNYNSGGIYSQYNVLANPANSVQMSWSNNVGGRTYTISGIQAGKWYHVLFVRNFTNGVQGYLNGVSVTTTAGGSAILPPSIYGSTAIGRAGSYSSFRYNGLLDEIRIYNRSLSAAEAADIYNMGLTMFSGVSNWSTETVSTGQSISSQAGFPGKFMQMKTSFYSNTTDVSPYLLGFSTQTIGLSDAVVPNASLGIPLNNSNFTNLDINFSVTATDDISGIANATLTINNQTGFVANYTSTTNTLGTYLQQTISVVVGLVDGIYNWFYTLFDNSNNAFQTETRTIFVGNATGNGFCDTGSFATTCLLNHTYYYQSGIILGGSTAGNLIIGSRGSIANYSANVFGTNHGASIILDWATITIISGGNITGGNITLIADNLTLNAGSKIYAEGLGYLGETGTCRGDTGFHGGGAGGGHGGYGADASGQYFGGCAHDSLLMPTDYGTGGTNDGGAGTLGKSGGGIVHIYSQNILLNSNITTNGISGSGGREAGGAGGSIYITTNNLSGNGLLLSKGGVGNTAPYYGGGGGGGRVAVYYNISDWTGLGSSNVSSGDNYSGSGSLVYNDVDHKQIYIRGGLATNVFNKDTTFFNRLVNSTWNFTGHNLTLDNINTRLMYSNFNLILENHTLIGNFKLGCNINYGYTRNVLGNQIPTSNLYVNITANNFTLPAGSYIDLSGCGYRDGTGPGAGAGTNHGGGTGGGHGGTGGANTGGAVVGAVYGSMMYPTTLGSAGGADLLNCGIVYTGRGGSAIFMNISGTLINNGLIESSGIIGNWGAVAGACRGGGGAGGSVWINAQNISGSGNFTAKGGASTNYTQWSGSGAGGRIAIYPDNSFNGIIDVSAGNSVGGITYLGQSGTSKGPTYSLTGGKDASSAYYFGGAISGDFISTTITQTKMTTMAWINNGSGWQFFVNANGSTYVNGVAGIVPIQPFYYSGNVLYLGKNSSLVYFNGTIDEVRVLPYNLSAVDVLAIYNNQTRIGKYRTALSSFSSGVFYNTTQSYWNTTLVTADSTSRSGIVNQDNSINVSNPNLMVYYSMDTNFNDVKTGAISYCNGYNNNLNCPSDYSGLSSNAILFPANLNIGLNISTNITTNRNWSMSAWIYPLTGTCSASLNRIFGQTGYNADWYIGSSCKLGIADGSNQVAPTDVVPMSQWSYITAVANDTNVTLWRNGNLIMTGPNTIGLSGKSYLGKTFDNNAGSYYMGGLDEFLVYNKSLSTSEINQLYKSGLSGHANTNVTIQTRTANSYNVSDPSLVGFWAMNNFNFADSSGNNGGVPQNGVKINKTGCKLGNCAQFDGVNDYVNLTYAAAANMATNDFTISTWINTVGSATNTIMDKRSNVNNAGYLFGLNNATQIAFVLNNGTFNSAIWANVNSINNSWHYLSVSINRTGNFTIYLDGALASTTVNNIVGSLSSSTPANIGRKSLDGSGWLNFNGSLDEFAIYNRSLSASEISNLYNFGLGMHAPADASLVSTWYFDEDEILGTDLSNGNNQGGCSGATCPIINSSSGVIGNGGYFPASANSFINISDSPSLNITGNITMSAWVLGSATDSGYRYIVSKTLTTGYNGYNLMKSNTNKAMIELDSTSPTFNQLQGTSNIQDGKWHHIVGTYNGTRSLIYVDGVLEGTGTLYSAGIAANNQVLKIGSYNYGANYYPGSIDEVRIYNRSLSAAEVLDLYNLGNMHINWSNGGNFSTTQNVRDGVGINSASSSKFMQFKSNFNSNNTAVAPYVLSYNVSNYPDIYAVNVTSFSPANNSGINNLNGVNFTANLTDDLAGIKNATLNVYNSTNSLINQNSIIVSGVSGTLTSTVGILVYLVDGIYNWFWNIFDFNDNQLITQNNTLTIGNICSSGTLSTTCILNRTYYFRDGEIISGTGNLIINSTGSIYSVTSRISVIINFSTVTIMAGGKITGANISIYTNNLTVLGTINTTGLGYAGGGDNTAGSGLGGGGSGNTVQHAGGGGAGYGGAGGNGGAYPAGGAGGTSYGSLTNPVDFGSGGGGHRSYDCAGQNIGGSGGGIIKLQITDTLNLTGNIYARGNSPALVTIYCNSGAGSGGSILINATRIIGAGSVNAGGATASIGTWNADRAAGGGAGGRIAVYMKQTSSNLTYVISGGSTDVSATAGGVGTVYLSPPLLSSVILSSTNISNNNTYQNLTILPNLNSSYSYGNTTNIYSWYKTNSTAINETIGTTLITNGLVAYYPLNNDTLDYAGANDGTTSGATLNYSGKVGGAYSFNGINDYINLGTGPTVNGYSEMTVSMWIRPRSLGSNMGLYGESTSTVSQARNTLAVYTDGTIRWGGRSSTSDSFQSVNSYKNISLDQWSHIVAIVNVVTKNITIYVNGIASNGSVSFLASTFSGGVSAQNIVLGKHFNDATPSFNGSLDEVMIFNRSLSDYEVQQLYTGSKYGGNILGSNETFIGDSFTSKVQPCDSIACGAQINSLPILIRDLVNPNAILITPANASYINNQTQNYTVNLTDESGIANATLNIYNSTNSLVNSTLVIILGAEGTLTSTVGIVVNLIDGIYNWFYNLFDFANNQFSTTNNTLNIDTTLPVPYFVSPTPRNDTGSNVAITIAVNVTEINPANATFAWNGVTYRYNSANFTNLGNNVWTLSLTNMTALLPGQLYYYNVTVIDLAGNSNTTETRLVKGNTAPVITVDNASTQSGFFNSSEIIINVSFADNEGNMNGSYVNLYYRNNYQNLTITLVNQTFDNSSGSSINLYLNYSSLTEGIYYLNSTATDAVGEVTNTSTKVIVLDRTSPNATLLLENNSYFDYNGVNLTVNLTDNLGIQNATLNIVNGSNVSQIINQTTINFVSGTVQTTVGVVVNLMDGIYQWFYSLFDWAGNANQSGNNSLMVDTYAPTMINVVYTPDTNGSIDPNTLMRFNVTVRDSLSSVNATVLEMFDGNNWQNYTMNLVNGSGTKYDGVWSTNFTTSSNETNYTFKILAIDTANNARESPELNFSSYWDCTWSVTNTLEATAGYSETKKLGNISITNTGDSNYNDGCTLTFKSQHNLESGKVTLNSASKSTAYSLLPGEMKNISVSYVFGLDVRSDAVIISTSETSEFTNTYQINATVTAVTSQAGPYLYQTISSAPAIVYIKPQTISLDAYISNLMGSDIPNYTNTAYNVSSNWVIDSAFTNLTGNISSSFRNITDSEQHSLNLGLNAINWTTILQGVYSFTLGSSGVDYNASSIKDTNNNSEFTSSVNVTLLCYPLADGFDAKGCWPTDPDTVYCGNGHIDANETCSTCSADAGTCETTTTTGSGGGGGGGGGGATSGSIAEKSVATYELLRGEKQEFTFRIENKYADPMTNVVISVTGINAEYITISPSTIALIPGKSYKDITVKINAPAYFTGKKYTLIFDILSKIVTNATTFERDEKKAVTLYILEVSRDVAVVSVNESLTLLNEMLALNLSVKEIADLIKQETNAYNEISFSDVKTLHEKIKLIYQNALESKSILEELTSGVASAEKDGITVTETRKMLYLAQIAFNRGDYALALERLQQAKLVYALEVKGEFNLLYAIKNNPAQTAGITLIAGFVGITSTLFIRYRLLKKKLQMLIEEEALLLELMKMVQRQCFTENRMSMEEYEQAMSQYESKLSETVEDKIRVETKITNILKIKGKKMALGEEKKRLLTLIMGIQDDYLNKNKIETRIYENMLKSYSSRLTEVDEQLAFMEAQDALKKEMSIRKMFKV